MIRREYKASVNGMSIALLVFLNAIFLKSGYVESEKYYWALLVSVPLLVFAVWSEVKIKK